MKLGFAIYRAARNGHVEDDLFGAVQVSGIGVLLALLELRFRKNLNRNDVVGSEKMDEADEDEEEEGCVP